MDLKRPSVGRCVSVYGGSAALRSVRIDIKRDLPAEISMPDSVRKASFNPNDYFYDFSREHDIVRRGDERRKASLAQIADQVEASELRKPPNSVLASNLSRGILQPTVLASTGAETTPKPTQQKIDLADFEDQSSTPFEDVALQTIDEMGELRQILQPGSDTTPSHVRIPEGESSTDSRSSTEAEMSRKIPVPKPRPRPTDAPTPKPRPRPDKSPRTKRLPPGAKPTAFAAAAAVAAPAPAPVTQAEEKPPSYDSLMPSDSLQQVPGSYNADDDLLPPAYEVDASVPAQPRRVSVENSFVGRSPIPTRAARGLVLPNPYSQLKAADREFVDSYAGMGFPKDRVARVVQKVGSDQKEVFDVLISINKIEEMSDKHSATSAEIALFNNELDLNKAVESLKIAFELKELGFSEEKILEALKKHDNNREKAIDYLLSGQ